MRGAGGGRGGSLNNAMTWPTQQSRPGTVGAGARDPVGGDAALIPGTAPELGRVSQVWELGRSTIR